jgi:prephenate dehydrogenase
LETTISEPTFFRRIAIVGLGLLGGSFGLALKKAGFTGRRVGCARRPEVIERALSRGVVDEASPDAREAVRDADLVMLATPVGAILDLLPKLKQACAPNALVTDVGSTKRLICRRAQEALGEHPLFLGGHPMAGKERSGLDNAEATLFERARYVLTPLAPAHQTDARVQAFATLVTSIGARPYWTDAARHDRGVAFLSHLPQLLSSSLASLIDESRGGGGLPLELAASGFRDVTRLAESPYSVWRDICLTNTENIQLALEALIQKLESMKIHLGDREMKREFEQAARLRDKLREIS